ncbi:MAG: hypothetical protein A3F41_05580 [Coxiella sp. RIFCSPHIGHO2_12_FULL_44_14]|nr:MAG: hypothetical protein A3F41_05580 [Coxiella sp. RIFCSPHIGHO2_12_FULL_44_14]
MISARTVNLMSALVCICLLISAYILQHFYNVIPCPLCLLQRFVYYALLFSFLIAGMHAPSVVGVRVYATISFIIALLGAGLAGRQVYLQLLPAGTQDSCLPGMAYMLKTMPLSTVITTMLKGSPECTSVRWSFLGVSLAGWSLFWFVVFALVAVWLMIKPRLGEKTRI